MMKGLMNIKIDAYETLEKTVTKTSNSGHVIVPKEWIGKRVKILLIESLGA